MVNTRDLGYFVSVAEHLHFTRAAASLFVTQPALSKQIASLERTVQARLFVRLHDGVALTPAGEALLPYARRIVELNEAATAEVQRAARSARKLAVGFYLTPANEWLGSAVTDFASTHPDVRLRLRRADWSEPGAGVVGEHADVAVLHTPHDDPIRGVAHHRLAIEKLSVVVPVAHRFAQLDEVEPSDLAHETVFVVPPQAGAVSGTGFLGSGPSTATVEYVTTIDETIEGVAMGLGVGVMTPSIMAAHPHPGVRAVPLHSNVTADYLVIWRHADEGRTEVEDLVKTLVSSHRDWYTGRF